MAEVIGVSIIVIGLTMDIFTDSALIGGGLTFLVTNPNGFF
jgi:hypothetical protein